MAAAVVVCAQDKILSSLIFLCVQTYFDAVEQGCWYSLALPLMKSWYSFSLANNPTQKTATTNFFPTTLRRVYCSLRSVSNSILMHVHYTITYQKIQQTSTVII